MRLWDWALEAYARQDVADACLTLQDVHGQNVPYLLWAAWAAGEGRTSDLSQAASLMRQWDVEVGKPLRGVRRALKPARPGVDDIAREAYRATIKAAELSGERLLMESLETLSSPEAPPTDLSAALFAAVEATGIHARYTSLGKTLDRLALALG